MRSPAAAAIILLATLAAHRASSADAIVKTRAMSASTILEAFVDESVVRLELEVGAVDLPAFANLLPDEMYERLDFPAVSQEDRLRRFFANDLVLTADGAPLSGRLVSAEPRARVVRDEISGEPLAVPAENVELVLFVVLEYPLETEPGTLTFTIPDRPTPGLQPGIGFVVYHRGVAANDFRYLMPEATIDLDWEDPWHSRFRSRQLRRAYDAPINVFLYVEQFEVRVEIIARPLDLQQWVHLGLEDRRTIMPEMYGSVQGRVAEFLAEHLALTIDGERAEPVLDRIHFLRRTLRTSTVIDPPEELSVFTAQLGAIFVVPRDGLPEDAEVAWDLFTERIAAVPAAATDEAGPMPSMLTPDDNVLRWKNFLRNPTVLAMIDLEPPPPGLVRLLPAVAWGAVLALAGLLGWGAMRLVRTRAVPWGAVAASLVLVVACGLSLHARRAAAIDDDRSARIVGTLLHNVYRAFDFREEGAVYDALARSISGGLLTQAYLDTKRSLELRSQGGAQVKVNQVDVVECRSRPSSGSAGGTGFVADCVWDVAGSVGHWGHIHQRRNRYTARVTVSAVDGAWRITSMELSGEERL
jgi:hypothetical protein